MLLGILVYIFFFFFVLTNIFTFLVYIPGPYSSSVFSLFIVNWEDYFFSLTKAFLLLSDAFTEPMEMIIWFSLSFFEYCLLYYLTFKLKLTLQSENKACLIPLPFASCSTPLQDIFLRMYVSILMMVLIYHCLFLN